MVRRTKEEAQETRERLLDAAGRMFCEKGLTSTSLDDIARAAGMTRGAIYWHFRNKADLVEALWERTRMPLDEVWGDCGAASKCDPLARIRANAIDMLQRAVTDPNTRQVWDIVFHKCETHGDNEPIVTRRLESRSECAATIEEYFCAAICRGQLPSHLDPRTALTGFMCYLEGLISNWLIDPRTVRLEELAEYYVDLYIAGLRHAPAAGAIDADQAVG